MDEASEATVVDDGPPGGEALGVALSGGGVRAALFSLGVLLYLVRSGLNERLRVLISVSGGSITNAALAASGDVSKQSIGEFEPVCQRLASRLAKKGSLFLPSFRIWLVRLVILCVGEGLSAWVFAWSISSDPTTWVLGVTAFVPILTIIFVALGRKPGQRSEYARMIRFAGLGEKGKDETLGAKVPFSLFPESRVTHSICATELTSGEPMYFSPCWSYSPVYGWGEPLVNADEAVYASAAFPAAFPPLAVATASLKLGGGSFNRDRPKELLLADGGVYNNLGNDWFTLARGAMTLPWGVDRRFPAVPAIDHRIIVNSSSPARAVAMPRLWPKRSLISFIRIMAILYENTLRPRVEPLLRNPPPDTTVIDITQTPLAVARAGVNALSADPLARRRAEVLVTAMAAIPETYWDDLVEDTSLTKTTLSPLGKERSARLMRHGYLSAMAALSPRFDVAGLDEVPPERYFVDLTEEGATLEGGTGWSAMGYAGGSGGNVSAALSGLGLGLGITHGGDAPSAPEPETTGEQTLSAEVSPDLLP